MSKTKGSKSAPAAVPFQHHRAHEQYLGAVERLAAGTGTLAERLRSGLEGIKLLLEAEMPPENWKAHRALVKRQLELAKSDWRDLDNEEAKRMALQVVRLFDSFATHDFADHVPTTSSVKEG